MLTKATNSMISGAVVNVFDFMTPEQIADVQAGTVQQDVTVAIQNAVNSLGTAGGVVRLPAGQYKTTDTLLLKSSVSLCGDGYFGSTAVSPSTIRYGATSIYAAHDKSSAISLQGAIGCTIENLSIDTKSNIYPKTGLLLGRSSAASAGLHVIRKVSVSGYYSDAAVYSIASEVNLWEDLTVWVFGGGAKYCFYTSEQDDLNVGPNLIKSTNLDNVFIHPFLISSINDPNAACLYINCGSSTGSWTFIGGYFTQFSGSYVEIASGYIDSLPALGPFTFTGCSGERLSGGDPIYGFKLTAPLPVQLRGLSITGTRLDFLAGANHYQIYKATELILAAPNIVVQPPEAFPYAQTDVYRQKVLGGVLSIGREYEWTPVTFESGWSNTFGAPYAQAGYCIDSNGFVHLRGRVNRSIAGSPIMFYLPIANLPKYDMIFSTGVGSGTGQILVNSSTGAVSLLVGTVTDPVDLNPVQFNFL